MLYFIVRYNVILKYGYVTELQCPKTYCKNGGTCQEDYEYEDYICECVPGFAGSNCQLGE